MIVLTDVLLTWPVGTTVALYTDVINDGGNLVPIGGPLEEAAVSGSGDLAFEFEEDGNTYVAAAYVGGRWAMRYVPTNKPGGPPLATKEELETLRERLPAVDLREWDAINLRGENDISSALEEAFAQAESEFRRVEMPAGDYYVAGVVESSRMHLRGAAGYKTRLLFPVDQPTGGIFGSGTAGQIPTDIILEHLVLDGQQHLRSSSAGNALLKAYNAERVDFNHLMILRSTSYGIGLEGYPGNPDPNKQYGCRDVHMDHIYIDECGYFGGELGVRHTGTPTSSDAMDIKTCDFLTIDHYQAYGASDKGINVRCRRGDLRGIWCEDNAVGGDFNSHRRGPGEELSNGPNNDTYLYVSGRFSNNIGGGCDFTATTGESDTRIQADVYCDGNGGPGVATTNPPEGGELHLQIKATCRNNVGNGASFIGVQDLQADITARGNGGSGVFAELCPGAQIKARCFNNTTGEEAKANGGGVRLISCDGFQVESVCEGNARGVYGTNCDGGRVRGRNKGNTGNGVIFDGTSDNIDAEHMDLRSNGTPITMVGNFSKAAKNRTGLTAIPTVASAEKISLPTTSDFIQVTGTNEVKEIEATNAGRDLKFTFTGAATFVDGKNLVLAGNQVGASSKVVPMTHNGTNYLQAAPASAN